MADEITVTTRLAATKPSVGVKIDRNPGALTFDMSGTRFQSIIQDIGTAYEAITVAADIGTEGWCYLKNLDTTNYVEIGVEVSSAFYPLVKLLAEEPALFPLAIAAPFARANTAAVRLEVTILER